MASGLDKVAADLDFEIGKKVPAPDMDTPKTTPEKKEEEKPTLKPGSLLKPDD